MPSHAFTEGRPPAKLPTSSEIVGCCQLGSGWQLLGQNSCHERSYLILTNGWQSHFVVIPQHATHSCEVLCYSRCASQQLFSKYVIRYCSMWSHVFQLSLFFFVVFFPNWLVSSSAEHWKVLPHWWRILWHTRCHFTIRVPWWCSTEFFSSGDFEVFIPYFLWR